jgi:iron complex transport system substrate-binding protein
VAFGLALSLAGCGSEEAPERATGSDGASPTSGTSSFPVTVEGTNGEVTIDDRPVRIVSLSPTATEDLFAIGAGDQVVAVDDRSNYPPEAPLTDLSGFEPNVEAIASYAPDLVVYATEVGDLGDSLASVGITALQLDAPGSLAGAYDQLAQLGRATGHRPQAEALIDDLRHEIESLVDAAGAAEGLSFYYELDDTYYSVTSETFIGQLFELLGLENVADAAAENSGGYPQLSAEYLIQADPDLIYLADTKCCGQSPQTVAKRDGWDQIAAVQRGNVVPLDDDIASRWGPRVVDLMRTIARSASEAAEENAA